MGRRAYAAGGVDRDVRPIELPDARMENSRRPAPSRQDTFRLADQPLGC
jgi:hypothetical protein